MAATFTNLLDTTWFCTASVGSTCPHHGNGDINARVDIAPGGSTSFEAIGFVVWGKPKEVVAVASVSPPTGLREASTASNRARVVAEVRQPPEHLVMPTQEHAEARAAIRDSDGDGVFDNKDNCVSVVNPDQIDTNSNGIGDPCEAQAGHASSVTILSPLDGMAFDARSDIPFRVETSDSDGSVVAVQYWINGRIMAGRSDDAPFSMVWKDAAPGVYSLEARATDSNAFSSKSRPVAFTVHGVDLVLQLYDGGHTARPGEMHVYTLTASNKGPDRATKARVSGTMPLDRLSWTCTASLRSSCSGSGNGNLATSIDLDPGGVITFELKGIVQKSSESALRAEARITAPPGMVEVATEDNAAGIETPYEPTAKRKGS